MENYKITLKAQKYLNANGARNYSSSNADYSNELPEPEDHDDDDDIEEAAPPPPPPASRHKQLALPAPPKGMRPGPRTAKLAQQLGKQVGQSSSVFPRCCCCFLFCKAAIALFFGHHQTPIVLYPQGSEKSKSNLQYIVQNGKLVLVQGQAAPPVQMQLKVKGPPGKPASAQARSLPPRSKVTPSAN